jgi:hypothetical protein
MKIFNLGDFNEDEVNRFIEFSNNNWEYEWCIYLQSGGGSTWCRAQIDEIVAKKLLEPQGCYLNVAMAYSSGFKFMMNFNILNDARGMWHLGVNKMDINEAGKEMTIAATNYGVMMEAHRKHQYKKNLEWVSTFMSEKEIQDYKNGKIFIIMKNN